MRVDTKAIREHLKTEAELLLGRPEAVVFVKLPTPILVVVLVGTTIEGTDVVADASLGAASVVPIQLSTHILQEQPKLTFKVSTITLSIGDTLSQQLRSIIRHHAQKTYSGWINRWMGKIAIVEHY
jgi:hypothetical protein